MPYCALTKASPDTMALRIQVCRSNPMSDATVKAARFLGAAPASAEGGR